MEADSTTIDGNQKDAAHQPNLTFIPYPGNLMLYKELSANNGEKNLEIQIVERLQEFGLLPKAVKCPTGKPDCQIVSRTARVIDRIQWVCEGCGKRLPIRTGSFFLRIQCSLLQSLQMIFSWCEDADCDAAAQSFGVKPRVATMIYDKLDELMVKEQNKCKLGGDGTVVLTEMYPDCLMRLSPDTTDQPHVHRILMIADTKRVPTQYHLHVIREDLKKPSATTDIESLTAKIEGVVKRVTVPGSTVLNSNNVPSKDGVSTLQQLLQHCDVDMQHFLTSRIWRQAITLCTASRSLCGAGVGGAGAGSGAGGACAGVGGAGAGGAGVGGAGAGAGGACAGAVQRYLLTALQRLPHADGFYRHVLGLIADEYTEKYENEDGEVV